MAEESVVSEEKMEALKKAYAEIILNTSKEAATRVMEADRKARYFEQQLVSLKEESLSMLLHLKDHFNSTIVEAEARSLKQQMKIEELDAQLCEAEGIIVDLRGELRQVQEKLEIMKHNQKIPSDEHLLVIDEPVQRCLPQDNVPNCSGISQASDAKSLVNYENKVVSLNPAPLDNNKSCHTLNRANLSVKSHLSQLDAPNDDFSSIIMRNRGTDLCRNGCTQRIRAFEGSVSNVRLPTSQSEDQKVPWNIQSITNADETVNRRHYANDSVNSCKEPLCFSKADQTNGKSISLKHLAHHSSCYKDRAFRPLRRSARKNARYREAIASLHGSRKKFRRTQQQPFWDPLKGWSRNVNVQAVEIPIGIAETVPKKIKVCRVSEPDGVNVQAVERPIGIAEMDSKKIKVCCVSELDGVNVQAVEIPIGIAEMDPTKRKVCHVSGSDGLSCNSENAVCAEERNGAKTRDASIKKSHTIPDDALLDSELVDVPISEEFGRSNCQLARDNKFLKFTFHRKRRKNVLGKIDNIINNRDPIKRIIENPDVALAENGI